MSAPIDPAVRAAMVEHRDRRIAEEGAKHELRQSFAEMLLAIAALAGGLTATVSVIHLVVGGQGA